MTLAERNEDAPRQFTSKDMMGEKKIDPRYPNSIFLSEGFLKIKLKAVLSDFDRRQEKEGKITDIGCPLCQREGRNGSLKLESIEGLSLLAHLSSENKDVHDGNVYKYVCSNPACQGKFVGGCRFSSH